MTTVTLRPDGTLSSFGVAVTGAASEHAALNDSSDASYIAASVSAAEVVVSMGTSSLPAGAVTKTVALVQRDDSNSAGLPPVSAVLTLADGSVLASVTGGDALASRTGAAAAVTLAQADVDGLRVVADLPEIADRLYDVYATLVFATQPTTAVSAPSGVQSASAVTVSWSHTAGSDGGSQSRFHARIFSAAEYGVSGFNPETSPCTWDSLSTASSATSVVSGTLANATTYRAYVRTAQTINGAAHWAEWDYEAFSTSYTTPEVDTVTVTGDDTNARHRITVTRNTGTPLWVAFDLERSDDSGTTWIAVRGATAATPPGDVWIGYDYEGSNGVPAIFRARASTATITGAWTSSSAATWTTTDHWLKDLLSPGNSMVLEISDMPQRRWGIVQGMHRPVGRVDPVVVSDVRQSHTATVTFEVYTAAEADELRNLLNGQQLLLQIAAGLGYDGFYLIPGEVSERHGAEQIGSEWRYIEVSYVEVAAPPDDGVTTVGLTWQDVLDSYATWQDLVDTGMTWGDLV